jgi:hypothetical protein
MRRTEFAEPAAAALPLALALLQAPLLALAVPLLRAAECPSKHVTVVVVVEQQVQALGAAGA